MTHSAQNLSQFETAHYQQSIAHFAQARQVLAGGTSSNFRLGGRPVPLTFTHSQGSRLFDVDENEYIDYALGMGPCILGHAPAPVLKAVADTLSQGQVFAGQHPAEIELAREVCRLVPCAERVRFASSGSEVDHVALRLARAYTGRPKILRFEGHYHGWLDTILSGPAAGAAGNGQPVPLSAGQPASALSEVYILPWNDLAVFEAFIEKHGHEIAAVIMESILCNTGVVLPRPGYVERVREICTARGIVLIFDEVITGFRVGLNSAQGHLKVTPDMATFAKALAAGFTISAITGRADIMETEGVLHGGTYNSNVVSVAAGLATLKALEENNGQAYTRIYQAGEQLMAGLAAIARRTSSRLKVQGLGAVFNTAFTDQPQITDWRSYMQCDAEAQAAFVQALLNEGIHLTRRGTWFLSSAHSPADIEQTLRAVEKVLSTGSLR